MLHLLIAVNNSWVGDNFASISLICSSDIYSLRQLISFTSNISSIPDFALFFSMFSISVWDSVFINFLGFSEHTDAIKSLINRDTASVSFGFAQ